MRNFLWTVVGAFGALIWTMILEAPAHAIGSDLILYGAESVEKRVNEFCSYRVSVPRLQPTSAAGASLVQRVGAMNAAFHDQKVATVRDFDDKVAQAGACRDLGSSYRINDEARLATPLDAPVASVVLTHSYYTGGAHGLHPVRAVTFNAVTGERYASIADWFAEAKVPVSAAVSSVSPDVSNMDG